MPPTPAAPRLLDAAPRTPSPAGPWAMLPSAFPLFARMLPHLAAAGTSPRPGSARQDAGRVAVIPLLGTMTKGGGMFGNGTVQTRRDVRKAAADPDVTGILLVIDSPGGEVAGTADLAADVRAAAGTKPVFAHVDDLCASAAYWVASQCREVWANSDTAWVGSIGTFMGMHDTSEAMARDGVEPLLFTTGPLKGAGMVPGVPVSDAQQAHFQALVEASQKSFDAAVMRGRRMNAAQLAAVRTGAAFGAREALRLRLIDGIRPLDATLAALQAAR